MKIYEIAVETNTNIFVLTTQATLEELCELFDGMIMDEGCGTYSLFTYDLEEQLPILKKKLENDELLYESLRSLHDSITFHAGAIVYIDTIIFEADDVEFMKLAERKSTEMWTRGGQNV